MDTTAVVVEAGQEAIEATTAVAMAEAEGVAEEVRRRLGTGDGASGPLAAVMGLEVAAATDIAEDEVEVADGLTRSLVFRLSLRLFLVLLRTRRL